MFENRFINRAFIKALCLLLLPLCAVWNARAPRPAAPGAGGAAGSHVAAEFPARWQGRPLRPLALGEVEQRFARQFPGSLARLTDGQQVLVWRSVWQPTRLLHPAADCYQGLGYRIAAHRLELDDQQALWRCFEATRAAQKLRVCERIVDARGQGFTDTSAWYWAAALGRSQGPWQAITVARPL